MHRRAFLGLLGSGVLLGCGSSAERGNGEETGGEGTGTSRSTDPAGTGVSSAAADAGTPASRDAGQTATGTTAPPPATPNLLVIMCDQLRPSMWFPAGVDALLPNMTALKAKSVSFAQHFTAAIQCSPARASLLTGLYGRQHFVGKNVASGLPMALDPRFPTWGTLLGKLDLGYERRWFGKWHLSNVDGTAAASTWAPYGFSPGLDHDVGVGDLASEGDGDTVKAFTAWLSKRAAGSTATPWCTTVSLVNPHDIANTYATAGLPAKLTPPSLASVLPGNYESGASLLANKPRLQTFFSQAMDATGNPMPRGAASDPTTQAAWLKLMDLYIQYQRDVDAWIGQVLAALAASPDAARTIVIFTADHGEHGGSHALWNKHGTAYDETLRVPLYVHDPTGYWSQDVATERTQLTSSVDIAPLLLTLASGGSSWRHAAGFEHLARRPDLAPLLLSASAPAVRSYILHSSDSIGPQIATLGDGTVAANHVTALRTAAGKLVFYDVWRNGTATVDPGGPSEVEVYDYATDAGRAELQNLGVTSPGATVAQQLRQMYRDQASAELTEDFADPDLQAARASSLAVYCASPFTI